MHNITVTLPDDCYRNARIWAAQRDTSVSQVVKYILETLPQIKRANRAFPASNSKPINSSTSNPTAPSQ